MNAEGFISWALDAARTVEERYAVELLVDQGVNWWNSRHKIYKHEGIDQIIERKRQRALNPAYEPRYSEENVRKAAEEFPRFTSWTFWGGLDERPIRDLQALRFLPNLEQLHVNDGEVKDLSVLAGLPKLRELHFASRKCEDFSPLARCAQLRELHLTFWRTYYKGVPLWPELAGLEQLDQLEVLFLEGNLLAFPRGITWPKVKVGALKCEPLAARCLRDLPQLPACEFLTLAGVERLDGIEAFPRLRNLKLETDVRDFAPLTVLDRLTCFTCSGFEPVEIAPLARLPRLQVATFDARFQYALNAVKPRDFAVFAEAPALRELHVLNCPPVEEEVQMLNSLLSPWDDVLLAAQPRPLPPGLRMIVAPGNKHPHTHEVKPDPEDGGLMDDGLCEAEGRWVGRFVERTIAARLGTADWGSATGHGKSRQFTATIEAFAVVEKLPLIIEAMREVLTRLRRDYTATFMICLKSPQVKPTPAQEQMERQLRERQDEADWERRQQEQMEYLERLHRYELKKQLGEEIKPEDFVPPPPPPEAVDEEVGEDEEDAEAEGDDASGGDVAVKKDPDPEPWFDDDHPLADNYRLMGQLTLSEVWFYSHQRDIAVYLMGRQPDLEIPDEKKED